MKELTTSRSTVVARSCIRGSTLSGSNVVSYIKALMWITQIFIINNVKIMRYLFKKT